jgi:hypothetical protein
MRPFIATLALLTAATVPAAAEEPRGTRPANAGAEPALEVGVATVDITPPVGYRMSGSYHESISTGVHDPLLAKAMVIRRGNVAMALCVTDLTGISKEATDPARAAAAKATGIPREAISVSATHTHGGVLFYDVMRDLFHDRTVARLGRDPHEPIDYEKVLAEKVAEAIIKADAARRPATLDVTETRVKGLAFNRRFHMKSGPVRFNPGKGNPDIIRPAGPVDDSLPILMVRDATTGKPFASFSVFAMHVAVFGGTKFGADYPMHLDAELKRKFGPEFVSIFGEGCAGDINHVNVATRDPDPSPEAIGARLAVAVLEAEPTLRRIEPKLAAASTTVTVEFREATPDQRARARRLFEPEQAAKAEFLDTVEAYRFLQIERFQRRGPTHRMEVQAFRLAPDVAVVTLPHEVFVELGMAIKAASPFKTTLVVSLANDIDVYIPTRRAFSEGSYETVNSPVLPSAGDLLVEAAIKLLERAKRQ